ncbi:MAG: glycosyltransferase family 4 protein [Candidatus Nealsonbacteria bacterium]|nr:glycosyltransferase family 4 protein [Candidatus Nealsonbacteria bacterium]
MNILIATGIFPPDIGGPATYVEKFAHELNFSDFKTAVITYSDREPELGYEFPVIRISRRYPKAIRHFLYFFRLLFMGKDFDVVFAQNPFSAGFPAVIAGKILRKKVLLKIVGDAAWEHYMNKIQNPKSKIQNYDSLENFQTKKHDFLTELIRKTQKFVARSASKIIVPSQYLKRLVLGWGIPEGKIEVIYNAIEKSSTFPIPKFEAKKEIGEEKSIILSVGRLSSWKGFEALIEIMPSLIKENPNLKLIIVGSGEEKQRLELKIRELKIENSVKLAGLVHHQNIPLYFKAADVFVLNSEYEGLSHTILEAMQFGVPVVCSNKGGNPELVESGHNGFLAEYNNKDQLKEAILKILQDKVLQEKFIQNSYLKLRDFNWESLVARTINMLKLL